MSDAVWVGVFSLIGVIVTAVFQSRGITKELEKQSALEDARLEKAQAITDNKIEELTREVREHNNFAKRVPVLEEQIRVANHRIQDLEKKVG